jgi:hypothetical protein
MPKTAIVVHHFASHWGNYQACYDWHVHGNGWRDVGYHYIVNNGFPTYKSYQSGKKVSGWDGKVETGRKPDTSVGAHVKEGSMNTRSIGVSCVGNFDTYAPGKKQWDALIELLAQLCFKHNIQTAEIYYHRDWAINKATGKPYKSCPGNKFPSRAQLRKEVRDRVLELRAKN